MGAENTQTVIGIVITFALAGGVTGLLLILTSWLGPKRMTVVKGEPFECGGEPITLPRQSFSVSFYLVALLFIVFDIEIAFLYPWAVVFKEMGVVGFVEMMIFMAVLVAALIYAWQRGALQWE